MIELFKPVVKEKPWGRSILRFSNGNYEVRELLIQKGTVLDFLIDREREITFIIKQGSVELTVDLQMVLATTQCAYHVQKSRTYKLVAKDTSVVIEVSSAPLKAIQKKKPVFEASFSEEAIPQKPRGKNKKKPS